jgi:hypothetical protein
MKAKLLAPIGSAIAMFGFFMPWMSCGSIKVSGYNIAEGIELLNVPSKTGNGVGEGDMLVWLVFVLPLLIGILYLVFDRKRKLKKVMVPTIGAAVLGLAILAAKYIDINNLQTGLTEMAGKEPNTVSPDNPYLAINIEWGYWLTALAFAASIAGAWNYKDEPLVVDATALGTPLPDDGSKMNQDLGM